METENKVWNSDYYYTFLNPSLLLLCRWLGGGAVVSLLSRRSSSGQLLPVCDAASSSSAHLPLMVLKPQQLLDRNSNRDSCETLSYGVSSGCCIHRRNRNTQEVEIYIENQESWMNISWIQTPASDCVVVSTGTIGDLLLRTRVSFEFSTDSFTLQTFGYFRSKNFL